MTKYVYRLVALRDGKEVILCEYRGDDTGLYNMQIARVEKKTETCCAEKDVSCDEETCCCCT